MQVCSNARSICNSIEYSILVQWPKAVDMQYKIMKQHKIPLKFNAYLSFQMTGDVKCLKTYKNTTTMHWSEIWINFKFTSISTLLAHVCSRTKSTVFWNCLWRSLKLFKRFENYFYHGLRNFYYTLRLKPKQRLKLELYLTSIWIVFITFSEVSLVFGTYLLSRLNFK